MTEHYLDVLTVHLRGYEGYPIPDNLAEEIVLRVEVGAQVDLEQLIDELKEDVSGLRRIHQTITETSWGASSAGAEAIIEIPTMLTGLASGGLLTLERVGGMPGSSGMTCCGVRDDATSALSGGAGPFGGVRGAV